MTTKRSFRDPALRTPLIEIEPEELLEPEVEPVVDRVKPDRMQRLWEVSSMKRVMLILLVALAVSLFGHRAVAQSESNSSSYIVQGSVPVNARSCPRLNCAVVMKLAPGATLEVLETVQGDKVAGSTEWYRTTVDGKDVYVHSSLVTPASPKEAVEPADVSTTGWVEYSSTGMSIEAPRGWLNFSGDEDFVRFMVKQMKTNASPEAVYARYSNALILVELKTRTALVVLAFYDGYDQPLIMLQMNAAANLAKAGYNFVDSSIVDLPVGKALRMHYGKSSGNAKTLANEEIEYDLFLDRLMYCVDIYNDGAIPKEQMPILEAMVKTFTISSPADLRRALSARAGAARLGKNTGEIKVGQYHLWTYTGKAGEEIDVGITTDKPIPTGANTYLIIRAPNGEIIAEDDDASFSDLNPSIEALQLPQTGIYEIEVHSYDGFKSGKYTLTIGNAATQHLPTKGLLLNLPIAL